MPDPEDVDDQDLAEVFDEENITEDGRDIATSDLQRDVFDVTSVPEDADEALEPEDDFDPDSADEAELEEIVMADEDLDQPRSLARDDADLVATDDLKPADLEAGDRAESGDDGSGDADDWSLEAAESRLDRALDEGLKGTFPASDPVSITPRRG